MLAAVLGKSAFALGSGTLIDQVVAVPSTQGHFGGDMLQLMKTADIASDGSFSITLEQSYDWVLLLVNSQAASLTEKVVSYVAVKVDENNSLIAYSGASFNGNIDLGVLLKVGTEAQGTLISASSFGLTLDQLTAVAKSDNGFKHMINAYLNYNAATGIHYTAQPIFSWSAGAIAGLDTAPVASAISSYVMNGFNLNVETNNVTSPALPDAVCSGSSLVSLFPSADIADSAGANFSPTSGLANNGAGVETNLGVANSANWFSNGRYYCYDDDFGMQFNAGSSNVLYGFQGSRSLFRVPAGGMPAGHWIIQADSLTLAEFDLQVSSPLDDTGHTTIPVPMLRVNHAGDGRVSGLEVSWYLYDSTTTLYTPLSSAQISAINSLVRQSFIEVQDEDGTNPSAPQTVTLLEPFYSNNLLASVAVSASSTPWYFPNSAGDSTGNLVPTFIKVGLSMGGLEYQFVWGN